APDLINAEIGNIVWKKHSFQGMAAADAQLVIDTFRALPLRQTPTAVLLDSAYRLTGPHRRTVFHILDIRFRIPESCQFVSADEKLVNAIGPTFPNTVWLGNWA